MAMAKNIFIVFSLILLHTVAWSQQKDSLLIKSDSAKRQTKINDSLTARRDSIYKLETINPHRAALYSAILPGAGQVYNKKYWKVPIVWAAIGIPTYLY